MSVKSTSAKSMRSAQSNLLASVAEMPWLLPGKIVSVPGRGEMFVRHHEHADPARPTLLLLHGWTATADLQFFTAYRELSHDYSIIAVDHRGHGRGLRPNTRFTIEDCADDAAEVARLLGVTSVITIGYSMGGPISLNVWRRHSDLVSAMVLQATAMEWSGTRRERTGWKVGAVFSPVIRSLTTPRAMRWAVRRAIPRRHELRPFIPWMIGEMRRNDRWMVSEAGRAISRFDAREFAGTIDVPVSVVVTTSDRLVPPAKQRRLAETTHAEIVELDGDHFVTLQSPSAYAKATIDAVRSVEQRLASRPDAPQAR